MIEQLRRTPYVAQRGKAVADDDILKRDMPFSVGPYAWEQAWICEAGYRLTGYAGNGRIFG